MYKRIISAFLIFILIISEVSIQTMAKDISDNAINDDSNTNTTKTAINAGTTINSDIDTKILSDTTSSIDTNIHTNADKGENSDSYNKLLSSGEQSSSGEAVSSGEQSSSGEAVSSSEQSPSGEAVSSSEQLSSGEEPSSNKQDSSDEQTSSGEEPPSDEQSSSGEAASSGEQDSSDEQTSSDEALPSEEQSPSDIQPSTELPTDIPEDILSDISSDIPLYSTTQNYLIDTQAPYDGNYLLIANVSTNAAGSAETVGELASASGMFSAIGVSENYSISEENSIGYMLRADGEEVYDFDENGRGIIEPNSFLPELVLDESGVEYQADEEVAPIEYYVGYSRNFYLNTTSDNKYNSVDCVCVAISDYCTVWVPVDDPIYEADAGKMEEYMRELAEEFDSQFPKMTDMFGSKETVDRLYGDNDGKTALLCYDINGNKMSGSSYTAGYFFGADLNINYSNATKNKIDCLHIDSWQGMSRNTSTNTLNPVYSKRTMVHEFQHMINFSICRDNESQFTKLKIPTYLNEAYSEAAAHLCYGKADNRISYYNNYSYISSGLVSLIDWGGYSTLGNYSLSYLFSQYIRTQYAKDGVSGDTIYKDTMNELNQSNDLLSIIADKLGVTCEELLLNFRAALFLKNAKGIYGFGGEEWAESIRAKSTSVTEGMQLAPGAAVVVLLGSSFEPSGAGENIRFAGMYSDLTEDDIEVTITGENSITEDNGTLQLSASVSPAGVSQSVIFSLPNAGDAAYADVNVSGLVSAKSNGAITVRASSVYNPSRYADIVITISGQQSVNIEQSRTLILGGLRLNYIVTEPVGTVLYYTTNGEVPTEECDVFPQEGMLFDKEGIYILSLLAHDASGTCRDLCFKQEIVVEKVDEPVISAEVVRNGGVDAQRITIQMQDDAVVYYTTDGSQPSIENGIRYDGAFTIDKLGTASIKAVALKEGAAVSDISSKEVEVEASPVSIVQNRIPGYDGIRITFTDIEPANAVLYYTTDGKMPVLESNEVPEDGILFDAAGSYTLKVLGHDPAGIYRDCYVEDEVIVEQLSEPVISSELLEQDGNIVRRVVINSQDDAEIYYTIDGSEPSVVNGIKYEEAFIVDNPDITAVRAVAVKEGMIPSDVVSHEIKLYLELDIIPSYNPVFGGMNVNYTVEEAADIVLYYTMDGRIPTTESSLLPEGGILLNAAGTHKINILAHDLKGLYKDCYTEDEIVIEKAAAPVISTKTETAALGIQRVTLQAQGDAVIYYTVDSTVPTVETGIRYNGSFIIDEPGMTTVKAIALKEGFAASEASAEEINVQYAYDLMEESLYKPYMTQVSFVLDKNAVGGIVFSILPIMENRIVGAELIENETDFSLMRIDKGNDWKISLLNKSLSNKTYQSKVRIISLDDNNAVYADTLNIKLKVTDVKPKVSLKSVKINTAYQSAGALLNVTSKSGQVEVLGIDNGSSIGFTDNFELRDGVLYLKRAYDDFVKTAAGKPVLSGKLQVQVDGYEPQYIAINVKAANKPPALIVSGTSMRLNYNKLKSEGSFEFSLDKKAASGEKHCLEDIVDVSLNESGGSNYRRAAGLVDDLYCIDGKNIVICVKNVSPGTYTIPLLVSAGCGEEYFSNAKCNIKVVIDKENVEPSIKLSASKVKLNSRLIGEEVYISVNSVAQHNMELTGMQCEYAEMTKSVNADKNVSLSYDNEGGMLTAKITGEPSCNTYKFVCTPLYDDEPSHNGKVTLTVTVIDKTPSVSVKGKGSIDVLNRSASEVVYTIKKTNFTDEIESVEFERAEKITKTVLAAEEFFNEPALNEDSTVSISAKENVIFTKGMKYAFRLKFYLKGSGRMVVTKDITIKPKQSLGKIKTTARPVFYTYVNTGNNTRTATLQSNNGQIEKVEWNQEANKKVPQGIAPIIKNGQLSGVTFSGDGSVKKGTYKLTFDVYYEGQLWEKATSKRESYAKPAKFRLTVTVK